jgi:hypothetical protein
MSKGECRMPSPPNQRPGARTDDGFFHVLEDRPGKRYPELEKIVRDNPNVQKEMRRIWWDSDPYADPEQRREMGLLVRRNSSGKVWTEPFSKPGKRGPNAKGDYEIQPDVRTGPVGFFHDMMDWLKGEQTIATIHTHVANPLHNDGKPSSPDRKFATDNGLQGIIVGHNGQYYYGPDKLPEQPWRPWGQRWW